MLTRRALIILAAVLIPAPLAAEIDGPTAFITAIYKHVAEGRGDSGGQYMWLDKTQRPKYFSKSVVALWRKAEAHTPKGDALIDFDPVTNSQDPDVKFFKLVTERRDEAKATIAVTLTSHQSGYYAAPEDATIRYDLIRENGRWRINDIRGVSTPNTWSVRGMLNYALRD